MSVDSYFVDTNLLLYSVDVRHPAKQERAAAWMWYLWSSGAGRLSWQVVNEFYANAVKKIGMPAHGARRVARSLREWNPAEMSQGVMERAWFWMDSAQLSYWDGLILAAAEREGCRWLLSEDFQAARIYGTVEIVNPFLTPPPELAAPNLQTL